MTRIRLIHWKSAEAEKYVAFLRQSSYSLEYSEASNSSCLKEWRADPPALFLIDLSRLPANGREVAISLRQSRATRVVPILFCDGEPEKVEKTRALLPDAAYCQFESLKSAIAQALKNPPTAPATPAAMMDRYAGRSTAQKLGIKAGDSVLLIDAPARFESSIGLLPPDVEFVEDASAAFAAVTLYFASDPATLRAGLSKLRSQARASKLWVCWRKGQKAPASLSETLIRETGISLGLVDYKICAVNSVWSGLLFAATSASAKR